jgi:hypothetical protein
MSAVEVAPQRLKATLKTRQLSLRHPISYCTKKETGRLGPVSGASVEMRLHRSPAPLTQRIVRARFTSAGASRASQGSEERGNVAEATVRPVSDSVQWFQLFL